MEKEDLQFIKETIKYGLNKGSFTNKALCKFHNDACKSINLIDRELKEKQ